MFSTVRSLSFTSSERVAVVPSERDTVKSGIFCPLSRPVPLGSSFEHAVQNNTTVIISIIKKEKSLFMLSVPFLLYSEAEKNISLF